MKKVFLLSLLLGFTFKAAAYENRCSEKRSGSVASVCQGRVIPPSKARNFHSSSQALECSSEADHYVRVQQKYDFEKWANLLKADQAVEAQNLRKESQPDIKWQGTIPYQTVETWVWESCDLVTDGFRCGYDTRTRTVQKSRVVCSGSGKEQRCTTEYYTETETYEEPRTCYSDIEHREYWPCSIERMTFTANFQRPDYNQWKPGAPGYIDAIPNKYDLLPGEVEDVQVFTNGSSSSRVSPKVEVGDAWNHYSFRLHGNAVGAQCRQNDKLHVDVTVVTDKRNVGKKTPNAFKLPRNAHGEKLDPILWSAKTSSAGEQIEKGTPIKLRLADSSSGVINVIAEQSKKSAQREAQKQSTGSGKTADPMKPQDQVKSGFFKNTNVRVELTKRNKHLWDTTSTKRILLGQGEGIIPTTNILSDNQEIAYSDMWEIPLRKDDNPGVYASTFFGRDRGLKPGQAYYFEVSMYQKGARGLYLQDCDEAPSFWSCKFRWLGLGRTEGRIYSDPLKIEFQTDGRLQDNRSFIDKVVDFVK